MIKKIKKCWGNFLIDTFGVPPSVIWESCYLEFKEELDNMVMTENKRFKEQNLENHLNRIYDAKKGKVVFDEDIVDLLNELHDENEQLQARIQYLERKIQRERNSTQKQYEKWEKEAETKIKELSEENEQLKQDNNELENEIEKLENKLWNCQNVR